MQTIQFLQMDFPDDNLSVFINLDRVTTAKFQKDVDGTMDDDGDFHPVDTDTPEDIVKVKMNMFEIKLMDNDVYFSVGNSADKLYNFFLDKVDVYKI